MMLGNIIELADVFALGSKTHVEVKSPTIVEEETVARWRYRQFVAWIAANHVAVIDGTIVNPWYIFHRALIEFASSLCAYKEANPKTNCDYPFTPAMLQKKTLDCIKSQWPMLVPRFLQRLESPTGFFTWTGPNFQIWRRDELPPTFLILEAKELPQSPVFSRRSVAVDSQLKDELMVATSGSGEDTAATVVGSTAQQVDDGQGSNMDIDSDVEMTGRGAAETGESSSGAAGTVDEDDGDEGGYDEAGSQVSTAVSRRARGKTQGRAGTSGLYIPYFGTHSS